MSKPLLKDSLDYFSFSPSVQFHNINTSASHRRRSAALFVFCLSLLVIYRHICRLPLFPAPAWIEPQPDQTLLGVAFELEHPIEKLHAEGQRQFAELVERQSKSFPAAVAEYERRYKRSPPPGFDQWYSLAIKSNATIIDNFDTMMTSLEPFWGLSPREIRTRATLAVDTHDFMSHIRIQDHRILVSEDSNHGHTDVVVEWLEAIVDYLPDMDIPMSITDEPRIIVPHDELEELKDTCRGPLDQGTHRRQFEFNQLANQDAWKINTMSCSARSPARSLFVPDTEPNSELTFIRNVTATKDACNNPSAATQHGLFVSPNSLRWSHTLLPVFSRNTASTFQDILMPATDYTNTYRGPSFSDPEEKPWEEKVNQLYWRGASRDGHAHKGKWRQVQRFRFVGDTNDPKLEVCHVIPDLLCHYPMRLTSIPDNSPQPNRRRPLVPPHHHLLHHQPNDERSLHPPNGLRPRLRHANITLPLRARRRSRDGIRLPLRLRPRRPRFHGALLSPASF